MPHRGPRREVAATRAALSRDVERAGSQFFGGRVCLDFANTVDWRTSLEPVELIPDYPSFVAWSVRRHILSARAAGRLLVRSSRGAEAAAAMDDARALREQIWRIAERLLDGRAFSVTGLNRMLKDLPPQPQLVLGRGTVRYELPGEELREPLRPVLWSLTSVLTSVDAKRLGLCGANGCGWFFVDESPNQSRRWCSSETCGNRERVRRAYARK